MFYNISINQLFSKNFIKKMKKSVWYIWSVIKNPLLLHPLSRTRAATKWHSEIRGTNDSQFETIFCLHSVREVSRKVIFVKQRFTKNPWKRKIKKNFEKIWKIWNKVLIFASAFRKKAFVKKKRSMKRLHKQYVVQERRNEDWKIWFLRVKKNRQSSFFIYIMKEKNWELR